MLDTIHMAVGEDGSSPYGVLCPKLRGVRHAPASKRWPAACLFRLSVGTSWKVVAGRPPADEALVLLIRIARFVALTTSLSGSVVSETHHKSTDPI